MSYDRVDKVKQAERKLADTCQTCGAPKDGSRIFVKKDQCAFCQYLGYDDDVESEECKQ